MKEIKNKTIFFDAGGVLFDTELNRHERIRNILKSRGFSDLDIDKGLNKAEEFSKSYLKQEGNWLDTWDKEEIYWDKYYDVILNEIGLDISYSLKKQLLHHTHYAVFCKLFNEVKDVLERLHGSYRLAVISNAFPSMDWIFDLLNIRKYFEVIIISAFAGISKPDNEIYKIALNSMSVSAEECIFIDDKIVNIQAAEKLGFIGIHLDRKVNDLSIIFENLNW